MRWSRPESDFADPLCDSLELESSPEKICNAHGGKAGQYVILDNKLWS